MSVHLRVVENFRGSQKAGNIVDVRTGMGGGDCGYHFEVGKQYLVDAWDRGHTFNTGICSRTASLDQAQTDVRILRKIAAHKRPPELAGELSKISGPEGDTIDPFPGVAVSLQPEGGGASSSVIVDIGGFFEFDGVPEGRYRIFLNLPNTLSVVYSNFGKVDNGILPPIVIDTSNNVVCRAEIIVGPSANISGVVRFPGGNNAEGWVKADSVTADGRPWNTMLTSETAPNGSF
jgi:hypothetical protein